MTVTGCVERADQIIPGGTPSNTVDSLTFVLIDPTGTAADAGRGAVGTGGTMPSAKTPRIYLLDGEISQLNPHVGHKVEMTGALAAAVPAGPKSDSVSAANAPTLKVEKIKMVAETCAR